jgi:pyrimidine operon attenuation protein / uracil phosphoribosyltransferase
MQKRLIIDSIALNITISRLCQQLIENHGNFENTVILGLQPKGIFLADRIKSKLKELTGISINTGYLDSTFHRDDFRRRDIILPNATQIDFLIENKNVILVDDVLFTGRSVRSALDAMITFGRPQKVELLVLIDRKYTRDLPIYPDYVGKRVNTLPSEKVLVELIEQGVETDNIWLIKKEITNEGA